VNHQNDSRISVRIAGVSSILAGVCWLVWISVNGEAMEDSPRITKLSQLMMAGWNLLLVPAAIVLWQRLRAPTPESIFLYTICGIASLSFWAYGGATQGITPALEIVYLFLSGVWWIGIGNSLTKQQKALGMFTLILGFFALLDAVLSFFEPMPFYIYVLAAPKLPLSIIWDLWIGVSLLRNDRS